MSPKGNIYAAKQALGSTLAEGLGRLEVTPNRYIQNEIFLATKFLAIEFRQRLFSKSFLIIIVLSVLFVIVNELLRVYIFSIYLGILPRALFSLANEVLGSFTTFLLNNIPIQQPLDLLLLAFVINTNSRRIIRTSALIQISIRIQIRFQLGDGKDQVELLILGNRQAVNKSTNPVEDLKETYILLTVFSSSQLVSRYIIVFIQIQQSEVSATKILRLILTVIVKF